MSQSELYYESDAGMAEYAEFHYGESYFGVANFPRALAEIALAAMAGRSCRRALDLGCASGRASFELARAFEHVDGVDYSHRFVEQCQRMAEQGCLRYERREEGELVSRQERCLQDLGLAATAQRVRFRQGDACQLDQSLGDYDLVLAANLIDRLYQPTLFLQAMAERICAGGVLLIASPYTWLEQHTDRAHWLGGYRDAGREVSTLDGLMAGLQPAFRPLGPPRDVAFVIRETRRKYQHSLSQVSLWERQ